MIVKGVYYWLDNHSPLRHKPLVDEFVHIRYAQGTLTPERVSPFQWFWDRGDGCWRCTQDPMAIAHDEFVEAWSYAQND